jgi:hypothetical protein
VNSRIRQPLYRERLSFHFLVLCACAAVLGGCATPATYEEMVPTAFSTSKKHPQTVGVSVNGGNETDSTGKPQISDAAFTQALTDSIVKSQTFSKVIQGSGADYLLTVTLFGMEQPSFGFSFTVKMEVGWTLKRADNGKTVWQDSIKSEFTATVGDSFSGRTRLRHATEGAARNNISAGLARISELNL